jgi:hypothetical protein
MLLAQVRAAGGWGLAELLIAVIVVCAVLAVAYVALRAFGIGFPPWIMQIVGIVIVAVVAVVAIRFLLAL